MVTICIHALSVERKSVQKNGKVQLDFFFLLRGHGNFDSYMFVLLD